MRSIAFLCDEVLFNFLCAFKCRILFHLFTGYAGFPNLKFAAAGSRYRVALFVKIHSEIQTHSMEQVLDLVE